MILASLLGSVLAAVASIVCVLALRAATVRRYSELLGRLHSQRDDNAIQISRLTGSVQILEESQRSSSQQSIEEACSGGLTRSRRAQAIQLLRSGMSPESAASSRPGDAGDAADRQSFSRLDTSIIFFGPIGERHGRRSNSRRES